ncbi:L,D-transpeptidase family protein [Pontivivens ytuae]|nr:L,D-transpeptidase family protein [Pontivivens ytuae]
MPCAIGRSGITKAKREGDGATPAGAYELLQVMWRADRGARPRTALPTSPLSPADIWSDDPRDPGYNRRHRGRDHSFGHERMWRSDGLYDIVVETSHNARPPVPGAGSAIFVHLWRAPLRATEGCVAFSRPDLEWILARWRPRDRLVIQS